MNHSHDDDQPPNDEPVISNQLNEHSQHIKYVQHEPSKKNFDKLISAPKNKTE